jgi:hypothetical protein
MNDTVSHNNCIQPTPGEYGGFYESMWRRRLMHDVPGDCSAAIMQ